MVMQRTRTVTKLPAGALFGPDGMPLVRGSRVDGAHLVDDPRDPVGIGYDRQIHAGLAALTQEVDVLDYASAGQDSVNLSRDRVITALMLVADPYQHDVTTAAITAVEDAVDKVISALSIAGKLTYLNLSSTDLFLKGISLQNKAVYGSSLPHQDLATAVAADNLSRQAWFIPLGAMNDFDPFDITAGIPAEDEVSLILSATFGANNIIAAVAANGTVDPATNIYVVTYGVQGLSKTYRNRLPVPDFRFDHITSPSSTTTFNLQTGRYLKRTTLVNLAVLATNNQPRNDSNLDNLSMRFKRPTDTFLLNRVRWHLTKALFSPYASRMPDVNRDGAAAIITEPFVGGLVIDWRRLTKNPYGLNLYPFQEGDVQLSVELNDTTGTVHLYNEYYSMPDPSVGEDWPPFRGQ